MRNSKIRILGVPLDLGQHRRGVDMGPSAIRAAELQRRLDALGYEVEDAGDLAVVIPETHPVGDTRVRYEKAISEVCRRMAKNIEAAMEAGLFPITLGGDHSFAIGTVGGAGRYFQKRDQKMGIIWLDAHADMNTPDISPSGNVHGMSLACCVGLGSPALAQLLGEGPIVQPEHVVLVGVRDVDEQEKGNVRRSGIHLFTMREVDEVGMRNVMEEAVQIAGHETAGFHVSLDMDFVDPREAPGVGTPCPGGVTYREAHLAMEIIADSARMRSFEVAEVNPILDSGNQTANLAVELALSAFGKRII